MHKPIHVKNLCFSLTHKTCFEDFSAQISYGSKIGIIGRNGCGKSCLLRMLAKELAPTIGEIVMPCDLVLGFVPQLIEAFDNFSGGQRFNKILTRELSKDPNLLLLDEPTNHLDKKNRKALLRMLAAFPHTMIIASHDEELLRDCVNTIWHIDQSSVRIFAGHYVDYMREQKIARQSLDDELKGLARQKQEMHKALMREQLRAKKSKAKGQKSILERKWPTVVSNAKATRAQETSGKKKADIAYKRHEVTERLAEIYVPEIIVPTFSLTKAEMGSLPIVSIKNGCVGYIHNQPIVSEIYFTLAAGDRIALLGDNGSGKSTLLKGILNDKNVLKEGDFMLPKIADIGYLDQHYKTLCSDKRVLEIIAELKPEWTSFEIRRHLVDFLFRKNEEVHALVSTLSGGELVRLNLAKIAAITPKLLILDEITNNIDLETRTHIIQVLKEYPGAIIIICHELEFLRQVDLTQAYKITSGKLSAVHLNDVF